PKRQQELAASVRTHGILQPVCRFVKAKIISGHLERINIALAHVRDKGRKVRCVRASAMFRGQPVADPRQKGGDGTMLPAFCHGQKPRQERCNFSSVVKSPAATTRRLSLTADGIRFESMSARIARN